MLRKYLALMVATILAAFIFSGGAQPMPSEQVRSFGHPLDPYPGFGRSPEAALRDDVIALWEAYRQEALMSECMAGSGFEYQPEVDLLPEDVRAVSAYLETDIVAAKPFDPEEWNYKYAQGLSHKELDAYYRTLLGESAADIQTVGSHGTLPGERSAESFAQGGCYGDAREAVPSIWDARRSLVGQFERLRADVLASSTIQQTRADFRACMLNRAGVGARDPGEAEDLIVRILDRGVPGDVDAISDALEACWPIWTRGYRAAEREAAEAFVARNREALESQRETYANVRTSMRADESFMQWLQTGRVT